MWMSVGRSGAVDYSSDSRNATNSCLSRCSSFLKYVIRDARHIPSGHYSTFSPTESRLELQRHKPRDIWKQGYGSREPGPLPCLPSSFLNRGFGLNVYQPPNFISAILHLAIFLDYYLRQGIKSARDLQELKCGGSLRFMRRR